MKPLPSCVMLAWLAVSPLTAVDLAPLTANGARWERDDLAIIYSDLGWSGGAVDCGALIGQELNRVSIPGHAPAIWSMGVPWGSSGFAFQWEHHGQWTDSTIAVINVGNADMNAEKPGEPATIAGTVIGTAKTLADAGQLIVIVTPPALSKPEHDARLTAYAEALRSAAASAGFVVADARAAAEEYRKKPDAQPLLSGENIPTQAYHDLMAEQIAKALGTALSTAPIQVAVRGGSYIEGQELAWRILRADQRDAVEIRISTTGKDPDPKSKPVAKAPDIKEGKTIIVANEPASGRSGRAEVVFTKEKLIAAKSGKFPLGLRLRFYSGGAPTKVSTIPDMTLIYTGVLRGPSYAEIFEHPLNPDRTPWDKAWGIEATGFIDIPVDGVYQFVGGSDDGLVMIIAGQTVIDNDGNHGYLRKAGNIALAAGLHPVKIGYYNAGGSGALDLQWRAPGLAFDRVPSVVWRHDPNEKSEKRKEPDKKETEKK